MNMSQIEKTQFMVFPRSQKVAFVVLVHKALSRYGPYSTISSTLVSTTEPPLMALQVLFLDLFIRENVIFSHLKSVS